MGTTTQKIELKLIDDFPNHPYRVTDDKEMLDLVESIRTHGLIVPVIVRQIGDRYQMIAGHRRKHACELLGHSEIEAIVVNVGDEEATIMMVDSNCQREKLLPSEKAFAYKMKLDAIKRQGKRTDLTSVPVAHKLKSRQIIAAQIGESQDQVRRYVRLTYLVPELLELVDAENIKMRPAVELSYLDEEAQRNIMDLIDETQGYPTHAQAIRLRKAFEAGELTEQLTRSIIEEEKPNQKPKYRFSYDRLSQYIPKNLSVSAAEDFVLEALRYYTTHAKKGKSK